MPNTLAHLGAQGFSSRALKWAQPHWIATGCLIPDLPWILQRLAARMPGIDLLDLRLYCVVQASLFFCLLLSAALAMFDRNSIAAFIIIGLNCCAHLLLDACQTKWANGVHLFAPFSWQMINFGFFWPEHAVTYLLTAAGIAYAIFLWRKAQLAAELAMPHGHKRLVATGLLVAYVALPAAFMHTAERADNHFVRTLREREHRTGRRIEFDRCSYENGTLSPFTGEILASAGLALPTAATVSIKGVFLASDSIRVEAYHVHNIAFRDGASYIGIILVGIIGIAAWRRRFSPIIGKFS